VLFWSRLHRSGRHGVVWRTYDMVLAAVDTVRSLGAAAVLIAIVAPVWMRRRAGRGLCRQN